MTDEPKQSDGLLGQKIESLEKLTDVKFSNIEKTLDRMEKSNFGFTTKIETEEVKRDFNASIKRMEEAQAKHNIDDKESFGTLVKQNDNLKKIVWMGLGGISVIVFIVPLAIKFLFK